jgi:hypothetical protein
MAVVDDRGDERRIRREELERLVDEAREAERLGYLIRVLVETSLPHRQPENPWRFVRRRSGITLTLASPAAPAAPSASENLGDEDDPSEPVPYGLPYGSLPRVLLAWLGGEYKRTGERLIQLGPSHGSFLRTLGLLDGGGGPRSDRARLRWQLERLFAATVTSVESAESIKRRLRAVGGIPIIDGEEADPSPAITRVSILDTSSGPDSLVWWHPRRPGEMVWRSSVLLGSSYSKALDRAFPVSPRVLAELRRSPLAIDLYCWLTYFFFGFRDARGQHRLERVEPWEALEGRLGADYGREARRARRALNDARKADPDGDHRGQEAAVRELERKAHNKFRDRVARALVAVKRVYPEARVEPCPMGLRLRPSPPNVSPRPDRR